VIAGGAGSEQWVVQLGAYQEAGRVKLLLGKLKELGVPAFTEKVDTPQGQRTRVRAGPFASRDAAVKAQERVKIIGVTGPVAPK
jgi:DedD protein